MSDDATDEIYREGFHNALAGGRRSDNPYARGWARFSALVLPGSYAAVWDTGWQTGSQFRERGTNGC